MDTGLLLTELAKNKENIRSFGVGIVGELRFSVTRFHVVDKKIDENQANAFFSLGLTNFFILVCKADGRISNQDLEMINELLSALDEPSITAAQAEEKYRTIIENNQEDLVLELVPTLISCTDQFYKEDNLDKITYLAGALIVNNGVPSFAEQEYLKKVNSFVIQHLQSDSNASQASNNIQSTATGSLPNSSQNDQPLTVANHGFTMVKDDDVYYLSVGAEIKNPNPERIARDVRVKIIVKDSGGRILETAEKYIDNIDSNAVFYTGAEISIYNSSPANYTVQVNGYDFVDAPLNSTFASGIECSHYNIGEDRWGDTVFSANVHNNYNVKVDSLEIHFVFYDSNNKIVGGGSSFVGNMYSNSDDSISASMHVNPNASRVNTSPAFSFYDVV